MATALPLITQAPYVSGLEEDKPDNEKTTWTLEPLNGLQVMQTTSNVFATDYHSILMLGLKGWQNFTDGDGKEIPFSAENIKRIPAPYLQDIAIEILNRSELKDEQIKNSSSQ